MRAGTQARLCPPLPHDQAKGGEGKSLEGNGSFLFFGVMEGEGEE